MDLQARVRELVQQAQRLSTAVQGTCDRAEEMLRQPRRLHLALSELELDVKAWDTAVERFRKAVKDIPPVPVPFIGQVIAVGKKALQAALLALDTALGAVRKTIRPLRQRAKPVLDLLDRCQGTVDEIRGHVQTLSGELTRLQGLSTHGADGWSDAYGTASQRLDGVVDGLDRVESLRRELDQVVQSFKTSLQPLSQAAAAVRSTLSSLQPLYTRLLTYLETVQLLFANLKTAAQWVRDHVSETILRWLGKLDAWVQWALEKAGVNAVVRWLSGLAQRFAPLERVIAQLDAKIQASTAVVQRLQARVTGFEAQVEALCADLLGLHVDLEALARLPLSASKQVAQVQSLEARVEADVQLAATVDAGDFVRALQGARRVPRNPPKQGQQPQRKQRPQPSTDPRVRVTWGGLIVYGDLSRVHSFFEVLDQVAQTQTRTRGLFQTKQGAPLREIDFALEPLRTKQRAVKLRLGADAAAFARRWVLVEVAGVFLKLPQHEKEVWWGPTSVAMDRLYNPTWTSSTQQEPHMMMCFDFVIYSAIRSGLLPEKDVMKLYQDPHIDKRGKRWTQRGSEEFFSLLGYRKAVPADTMKPPPGLFVFIVGKDGAGVYKPVHVGISVGVGKMIQLDQGYGGTPSRVDIEELVKSGYGSYEKVEIRTLSLKAAFSPP